MTKVYAAKKKYAYGLLLYTSNMTFFSKGLLMFLTGTKEFDWGTKRNHHGEYVFKGYNLHSWYFISSIVESQKNDCPKTVAK